MENYESFLNLPLDFQGSGSLAMVLALGQSQTAALFLADHLPMQIVFFQKLKLDAHRYIDGL